MDCEILSETILVYILCRSDHKDIIRWKCVSKQWHHIISEKCIPKILPHISISGILFRTFPFPLGPDRRSEPNFVINIMRNLSSLEYCHAVCFASLESNGIRCYIRSVFSTEGFQGMPNMSFMSCKHEVRASNFMNCCNGLLLFLRRRSYQYYVCNPTTKQCLPLPKFVDAQQKYEYATLAFDSSEILHFRLVHFTSSDCGQSQSLHLDIFYSNFKEWIRHDLKHESSVVDWSGLSKHSSYLNGILYRLSFADKLLCIDLNDLKVNTVDLPIIEVKEVLQVSGCIGVSNGSLHFANVFECEIRVWLLNEDKDHQESTKLYWSLKHKICTIKFLERLFYRTVPRATEWIEPTAFHPDMDVIYIITPKKLIGYNLESHDFKSVHQSGGASLTCYRYFPAFTFRPCPIIF